ncbi:hypothetical protein ABZ816_39890 [Actinosynnema sp. NPDC047251]|uniref:Uncharacterized protein n=1 Tax=Saccharothrix espanaensis (strain ATCC 51144 / DSM 44229 / JCM 9112 / NBRC 15066 / NRRL 15764) TaxID=1179773 RepID=K0JV69_SACES|nr:hypothetical protein [Saccharothrix espanaensis]CCH29407.1 hypothetical protein BN6_20870 [Saccharothrix espanaensis DSM 44229]
MTENFNFHGPTTFINKPQNTVVQDFQNTHNTVHGEQLAELLRLVLSSKDLTDEEREETARLVEEAATAADTDEPAAVERRLTRIGRIVSRAADIATPASVIVDSVSSMFT